MDKTGISRDEAVRIEAYILSEMAGHPAGMEHIFWMQAEAIVTSRMSAKLAPKRKAAVKPVAPVVEAAPVLKPALKEVAEKAMAAVKAKAPKMATKAKVKAKKVKAPDLEPTPAPAKAKRKAK